MVLIDEEGDDPLVSIGFSEETGGTAAVRAGGSLYFRLADDAVGCCIFLIGHLGRPKNSSLLGELSDIR